MGTSWVPGFLGYSLAVMGLASGERRQQQPQRAVRRRLEHCSKTAARALLQLNAYKNKATPITAHCSSHYQTYANEAVRPQQIAAI